MDKQGERLIYRRGNLWAVAGAGVFALCLAVGGAGAAFGASAPLAHAQADSPTPTPNATIEALMQLDRSVKATQTAQAQAAATPAPPTSTPLPSKPTVAPTIAPSATSRPLAALAEVLVDGLNIRSGPGSSYGSIGKASGGMLLPISGQSGGCSWLRVVLEDGGEGWISGNVAYTSINVACAAIPTAGATDAAAAQAEAPALPAPTSTPATAARPQTVVQPAAPTPTRQPAQSAPAQAAPAQPAAPGQLTSFEPLGSWRRGDEPYGTIEQSSEQVSDGAAAARIDYDFPAAAGSKNYVVFLAQPPLRIPNDAASLQLGVYGDGSGNFLNIWVGDAAGQTWQFTFGRIEHTGWARMTATLTPNREWPNGPIDAASTTPDSLTPPLSLKAFVLDGAADGVAGSGTIYLDNLVASAAASAPISAAVAVSPAGTAGDTGGTVADGAAGSSDAAAASAPAVAPAPAAEPTGKIAFTRFNGQKMNTLVYDVAAGKIVAEIPNTRHPDLAGGLMLANGEGGGQETIMRMSDTGGSPRPITSHPEDAYPQWSPSMASLVYASTAYGDRRSRLFYQEDAGAQFEAPPMLYDKRELFGDNPLYLDNWRIAFQGCNTWAGGSKCGIYSTDSKGSEPVQATSLTADIPTGNLGSQILFASNRSGNYDVWVVNWDGGGLRQLTDNPAVDGLAAASPDYQHIAFVTNRDGVWSVYVMNADGSNQRKLFDIGGGYGSGEYDWQRERISWGP